jgi:transportin-3
VLDALLSRYSSDWLVAEQACSLIRRGLTFFQAASRPAIPGVLERMAGCFEQFPASGFLWITGKCGAAFAGAGDEEVSRGLIGAFERETVVLANLLRESSSVQVPDSQSRPPSSAPA